MSTNSTTGTAARSQRLGGSTVTRIASGEYVYAWGLTSYRIISVAAASYGESSERAWHVYRQTNDGGIGCYLNTFSTKCDAIAMLNELAYAESMAAASDLEADIARRRAALRMASNVVHISGLIGPLAVLEHVRDVHGVVLS